MSTKSQQVAQLLLRPEGCSYSDAIAVTGWSSISIQWHAKNNGLRLRVERGKGQPLRYFGERRKIEVRKVVKPVPASEQKSELAIFCAAYDFAIHCNEGKNRVLRCIHCHLGFRIFQKDDSANPYLKKHLKQHARIHHPSYLAQSLQGLVNEAKKERFHEQCG